MPHHQPRFLILTDLVRLIQTKLLLQMNSALVFIDPLYGLLHSGHTLRTKQLLRRHLPVPLVRSKRLQSTRIWRRTQVLVVQLTERRVKLPAFPLNPFYHALHHKYPAMFPFSADLRGRANRPSVFFFCLNFELCNYWPLILCSISSSPQLWTLRFCTLLILILGAIIIVIMRNVVQTF